MAEHRNNPRDPAAVESTYLDHAASTPVRPEAVAAMTAQLAHTGNPAALHASGRRSRQVVEESREALAASLGCRPGEVVFTSGGTEADNLAVKGLYWSRRAGDRRRRRVITTAVEHPAVLEPVRWLAAHEQADAEVLPVDEDGRLALPVLAEALAHDPGAVALLSMMWANNETGTVQPLPEVVALAREYGVPVHTDAVQAIGGLPVDVGASGVDALTLSAHKLGGPPGVGALVLRRDHQVVPLVHGGGQERDLRSGTVDAASVAGLAAAVVAAVAEREEHAARLTALRDDLVAGVRGVVPDVAVNGGDDRLPGHANLSFPGCEGDSLLMLLDFAGVECSTGSACSAGIPQASHVLHAMGRDEEQARSSLRFSLGHTSTAADVEALVTAIGPAVERARAAGARGGVGRAG